MFGEGENETGEISCGCETSIELVSVDMSSHEMSALDVTLGSLH